MAKAMPQAHPEPRVPGSGQHQARELLMPPPADQKGEDAGSAETLQHKRQAGVGEVEKQGFYTDPALGTGESITTHPGKLPFFTLGDQG